MITVVLAVVICCLLAEGFFSGSEIAIVSADRTILKKRADGGDRGASLVLNLLADSRTLLSTTLVGTNLAVVTSTVVVTLFMISRVPRYAELYTLAVMTPTLLLMGEVIPKSVFQQNADRLASRIVYPLMFFRILFAPVLFVLKGFTGLATRILRVEADRPMVSREELQHIIETVEKQRGGEITAGEAEMISNVLDADDRIAEQVMMPLSEVCSVDVSSDLIRVVQLIREKRHTRIPIYDGRIDNIVGIVHAFDLIEVDPGSQTIRQIMRPPIFVPEAQPVLKLVVHLEKVGQRMAVVVNEYGGAEGVVTLEDALEEIVGEMDDEYDTDSPRIVNEGPGVYRVEARTRVERLNRRLGLELPEGEDYETVAGLVLDRLKRMPRRNERVTLGNVILEVTDVSSRAIREVRIRVPGKKQRKKQR